MDISRKTRKEIGSHTDEESHSRYIRSSEPVANIRDVLLLTLFGVL